MNRYSSRGGNRVTMAAPVRNRSMARVRALLFILLIGGLVVSLAMGIPAMNSRTTTHSFIVNRMATECKTAYDLSQTMSLTASTNSYEKLARIRSCIYGMEMLANTDHILTGSGALIDESVFSNLYSRIESYNGQLITGMSTAAQLTDLQNALEDLYQLVLALN